MELTVTQRWLLLAPPIACLGASLLLWLSIQLMFGNLAWLFPIGDRSIPPQTEAVMTPGMKIFAKTPACELTITAGRGRMRSYTWEGATRSIETIPRPERWDGSFGLYFPGPGNHWFPHHGITRCVADEGQLNFSTVQMAQEWLSQTPAFEPRIYRNDGLVVWVNKNQCLGIDIYQIYINGKKPKSLAGAQDDKIRIESKQPISPTTSAPEILFSTFNSPS
jgi:hypothetical protein